MLVVLKNVIVVKKRTNRFAFILPEIQSFALDLDWLVLMPGLSGRQVFLIAVICGTAEGNRERASEREGNRVDGGELPCCVNGDRIHRERTVSLKGFLGVEGKCVAFTYIPFPLVFTSATC